MMVGRYRFWKYLCRHLTYPRSFENLPQKRQERHLNPVQSLRRSIKAPFVKELEI